MSSLVFVVAIVGSIATVLMILGMLYLVWISVGDDTHAPRLDGGEGDGTEAELDGETA